MCKKHGKPIMPSAIKNSCKTCWCSQCKKEWKLERKKYRSKQWEENFISCSNHPGRRCNRSTYVASNGKHCSYCCSHRKDRSSRPAYKRQRYWNLLRKNAKRILAQHELSLQMGYDPITGGNIHSV